ncbi:leucine-rich repeat-containing protein 59-like [Gordionus sp. m RMFG-2023]|uniref:leucine-rich repeat-containing protein 59-like n=1 Tax=Gordionus sp. m RMFG-2023 TaxID=3053472 RepID=UPI0031FDEFD3
MTQNAKVILQGNKIDFSLSDLTTVPIKSILNFPRYISLDLSCNKISHIGTDFCSLVHIVDLDISRNLLSELPEAFGNLIRLQHLDLSDNHLTNLPTSFYRLSNLKYLDLKGNPLNDKLRPVAGFCLDESECKSCAKKVVAHYKNIQATIDKQKQKEEQIRQDALRKMEEKERKEQEAMRMNKKLEKDKRRLEIEQKRLQEHWNQDPSHNRITEYTNDKDKLPGNKPFKFSPRTLVLILFALAFICAMFYFLWVVGVGPSAFMTSDL